MNVPAATSPPWKASLGYGWPTCARRHGASCGSSSASTLVLEWRITAAMGAPALTSSDCFGLDGSGSQSITATSSEPSSSTPSTNSSTMRASCDRPLPLPPEAEPLLAAAAADDPPPPPPPPRNDMVGSALSPVRSL